MGQARYEQARRAIPFQNLKHRRTDVFPETQPPRFPIIYLPPEHALYDDSPQHFFPICTWQDCYDKTYTFENEITQGNLLIYNGLLEQEAAEWLLTHLEEQHNLKHVVAPFEPYGLIYERLMRVWKDEK
jgi:hypothetical protein